MKFKEFLNLFKTDIYNRQHRLGVAHVISVNPASVNNNIYNDPVVAKANNILKDYKDVSDVVCLRCNPCQNNDYDEITMHLLRTIHHYIKNGNTDKVVNNIIMLQDVKGAIIIMSDEVKSFASYGSTKSDDIENEDDDDRIKSVEELQEEIAKKYSRARYDDDIIYKHYY